MHSMYFASALLLRGQALLLGNLQIGAMLIVHLLVSGTDFLEHLQYQRGSAGSSHPSDIPA